MLSCFRLALNLSGATHEKEWPGITSGPFVYLSFCLRGLPPPTPLPGRCAFHRSMVSGSQPRVRPMRTSGSGRS
nr:MAG TPA: hypothetical protein [Caudoviricetes sp.]